MCGSISPVSVTRVPICAACSCARLVEQCGTLQAAMVGAMRGGIGWALVTQVTPFCSLQRVHNAGVYLHVFTVVVVVIVVVLHVKSAHVSSYSM